MQFTEEQREVLAGLCRIEIKRWKAASESNPNMRYMVELMEISLAALAAEPVAFLGEADGEFEYNGCRSFSFCPEKVTEFYSAPPVAAPAVPDGWQLVPVEPTREMCDAFDKSSAWEDVDFWEGSFDLVSGWEAMLSVAPSPPETL